MASLTKIGDQWRVRYYLTTPQGIMERSRRFHDRTDAVRALRSAEELEETLKAFASLGLRLRLWQSAGLLSQKDVARISELFGGLPEKPPASPKRSPRRASGQKELFENDNED